MREIRSSEKITDNCIRDCRIDSLYQELFDCRVNSPKYRRILDEIGILEKETIRLILINVSNQIEQGCFYRAFSFFSQKIQCHI